MWINILLVLQIMDIHTVSAVNPVMHSRFGCIIDDDDVVFPLGFGFVLPLLLVNF